MTDYKLCKKSINSKTLFFKIHDFIEDAILNMGVNWSSVSQRESFVVLIDEWLAEHVDENAITHYKVVCDRRNNKKSNMKDGIFYLDVEYRQTNCLNITKLLYTISENDDNTESKDMFFGW